MDRPLDLEVRLEALELSVQFLTAYMTELPGGAAAFSAASRYAHNAAQRIQKDRPNLKGLAEQVGALFPGAKK